MGLSLLDQMQDVAFSLSQTIGRAIDHSLKKNLYLLLQQCADTLLVNNMVSLGCSLLWINVDQLIL